MAGQEVVDKQEMVVDDKDSHVTPVVSVTNKNNNLKKVEIQ